MKIRLGILQVYYKHILYPDQMQTYSGEMCKLEKITIAQLTQRSPPRLHYWLLKSHIRAANANFEFQDLENMQCDITRPLTVLYQRDERQTM